MLPFWAHSGFERNGKSMTPPQWFACLLVGVMWLTPLASFCATQLSQPLGHYPDFPQFDQARHLSDGLFIQLTKKILGDSGFPNIQKIGRTLPELTLEDRITILEAFARKLMRNESAQLPGPFGLFLQEVPSFCENGLGILKRSEISKRTESFQKLLKDWEQKNRTGLMDVLLRNGERALILFDLLEHYKKLAANERKWLRASEAFEETARVEIIWLDSVVKRVMNRNVESAQELSAALIFSLLENKNEFGFSNLQEIIAKADPSLVFLRQADDHYARKIGKMIDSLLDSSGRAFVLSVISLVAEIASYQTGLMPDVPGPVWAIRDAAYLVAAASFAGASLGIFFLHPLAYLVDRFREAKRTGSSRQEPHLNPLQDALTRSCASLAKEGS